jgi:hypothetical protein
MTEKLLILFLIKHFLIDFVTQTEYQWKNKGTFLHPGGLLHSSLHGLGTYIILLNTGIDPVSMGILDFGTHYTIDFCKTNLNKILNIGAESQIFWFLVGLDQLLHYLVYIYIIF